MTKLQHYDELDVGEGTKVCGGAVFLKLMKKAKCTSSSQKHESPMLTSSSSFSSSQASSMIEYDPSKAHFCMPKQMDGEEGHKLDFKLQAEEHSDFLDLRNPINRNSLFFGESSDFSNGIVHLNPQAVNQLRTMHLQSRTEDLEKGTGFEPRNNSFAKEKTSNNDSEDIDAAFAEIQLAKETPSRASALRKEMSSFRKELKAVKRSLPNQFENNVFEDDDSAENRLTESPKKDPAGSKSPRHDAEANYFKKDWNLNFHDRQTVPNPEKKDQKTTATTTQHVETSRVAVLEPKESFPECPEMPFDQGDIALQASSLTAEEDSTPKGKSTEADRTSNTAYGSNYKQDMDLVRMLLKKYGDKIDDEDKMRIEKARRLHAIVDQPTDAWFHRHASGVCKKPEKLSVSDGDVVVPSLRQSTSRGDVDVVQATTPQSTCSRVPWPTTPERARRSYVTPKPPITPKSKPPVAPQKTVHFNTIATYVEAEDLSVPTHLSSSPKHLKSAPGLKTRGQPRVPPRLETSYVDDRQPAVERNSIPTTPDYSRRSPGRLSDKIKYWEQKKI